jgi:hypothetical protein
MGRPRRNASTSFLVFKLSVNHLLAEEVPEVLAARLAGTGTPPLFGVATDVLALAHRVTTPRGTPVGSRR